MVKNNEVLGVLESVVELVEIMGKRLNTKLTEDSIRKVASGKKQIYKGYKFFYITQEEYYNYNNNEKEVIDSV